jgi:DNA polymerase-3 subunit gamma/tau
MRDALSLTDQAIGHGGGKITESDVNAMLGTIDRSFALDICRALITGEGTQLLAEVDKIAELSPDYEMVLADLLALWHQVAIMQTVPEAVDKTLGHYSQLAEIAQAVSREDVQLFYQICLLGRKDLDLAPDAKAGFEMVLLRALAFRPDGPSPKKNTHPQSTKTEGEQPVKKPQAEGREAESVLQQLVSETQQESTKNTKANPPAYNKVSQADSKPAEHQVAESEPDVFDAKISLHALTPDSWVRVHQGLELGGSLGEIASHCLFKQRDGKRLIFVIDQQQTSLYDSAHQQTLAKALSAYFGTEVEVEITFGTADKETPRAANIRAKEERLAAAIEVLNQDPDLQEFKQRFDARLDEKSVRPID